MKSQSVSVSRVIDATPEKLFGVVSDASLHHVIDGSGSVRGVAGHRREPLTMGSKFQMRMVMGVPYRISNKVVEFEQDRVIAWQHIGGHRWRYEFEPVTGSDGEPARTKVTETFDWSTSRAPKAIELAGYPSRHPANMERTLERLDAFVNNRSSAL